MLQSFPPNVANWDRNQVKHWLRLKGFSAEIQNTFYNETIDGETILYLKEADINTLTSSTSITFGKKLKLKTYIAQLQSNPNKALLSSLSPTHKLIHIGNIHASPLAFHVSPPRYLTEDKYPNPSSSNSTFDQSSNIPSDYSNSISNINSNVLDQNNAQKQQISVNALQTATPCQTRPHIDWIHPEMKYIKKEKVSVLQSNDIEDDHDSSLEPILNNDDDDDINTYITRRKRKRMVIDDSSDDDDGNGNNRMSMKKEINDDDDVLNQDRECRNDDNRPFKRFRLSLSKHNHIPMTLRQRNSGKYAIRSSHNVSKDHKLMKEEIMHKSKRKIKSERKHKRKTKKTVNTFCEETFPVSSHVIDKREIINNIKKEYRYTKENNHDLCNVGKRWTPSELEIVWNLHYEKHWTNIQIAEKFSRTECGIMVQIDKMYKDKRALDDLINKKYLYQQKVDSIIKGEKIWCSTDHKWKMKDEYNDVESSSSEDDDEPIGIRMARKSIKPNEMWDILHMDNDLKLNDYSIFASQTKRSTAFLGNIVSLGRHGWKFRFVCISSSAPFRVGLWRQNVAITDSDLSNYIGKYSSRVYVFDAYSSSKNKYDVDNEWTEDNSYGLKIQNGDTVSMEVDFNTLTLRFSINGVDFGVAHRIKSGTYKAVVSVFTKGTQIELLSYTAYNDINIKHLTTKNSI